MLNKIKELSQRSGVTYALKRAAAYLKQGIGTSKREAYEVNNGKSGLIHSHSTANRYLGIIKEFVSCAKNCNVNRLDKVSPDLIDKFFTDKIKKGYTQKTLKINLCAMEKFFAAVGRDDLKNYLGEKFSHYYSQASPCGRTMPFDDPVKVISNIKNVTHKAVATIQHNCGARIGDVKKITIDAKGQRLIIKGSKGGRDRSLDFSDRPAKLAILIQSKSLLDKGVQEYGWDHIRRSYYPSLKAAVKAANDLYTGAHAFRACYANERFEQLTDQGMEHDAALKLLTEELGHSRLSMARYYLL